MHAKSLQSCPTLCDPTDGSQPGSSVPGILQARILEWVAISFFNAHMHAKSLQSCPTLCDPLDGSTNAMDMNLGKIQEMVGDRVAWEKEMATHSSILAWRIPWTEEPSRP